MKKAIFIVLLLPVLSMFLMGCPPSGESETQIFATGAGGQMKPHAQTCPDCCLAAVINMIFQFTGYPQFDQQYIMTNADMDFSNALNLTEARDYINQVTIPNAVSRYNITREGFEEDSITQKLARKIKTAIVNGSFVTLGLYNQGYHALNITGISEKGGVIENFAVLDPSVPDSTYIQAGAAKGILIDANDLIGYASVINNQFQTLALTGSLPIVPESKIIDEPSAPSLITKGFLKNKPDPPEVPAYFADPTDGFDPDDSLDIATRQYAFNAVVGTLQPSLWNNSYFMNWYAYIMNPDSIYFAEVYYVSSTHWDWTPPSYTALKIVGSFAPSIYMRVVALRATLDNSLAGAVMLLDADPTELLAIPMYPRENERLQNSGSSGLFPVPADEIEAVFGNQPSYFVSPLTISTTGPLWGHTFPCMSVIDSATGEEVIMNAFGSYMEMDYDMEQLVYTGEVFKSAGLSNAHAVPRNFKLKQNYPNPFNPETQISFDLPQDGHVTLDIYNLLGREVMTLIDEERYAGTHVITWDGTDKTGNKVTSGIYFYKILFDGVTETRKMLMMK